MAYLLPKIDTTSFFLNYDFLHIYAKYCYYPVYLSNPIIKVSLIAPVYFPLYLSSCIISFPVHFYQWNSFWKCKSSNSTQIQKLQLRMYFERMLWGNSWFIKNLKLRSLQNLKSRDFSYKKKSDFTVNLTEFSVNVLYFFQKIPKTKKKKTKPPKTSES